jgi:hypothetical protein
MGTGKQNQVEEVKVGAAEYRRLPKHSTAGKCLAMDDNPRVVRKKASSPAAGEHPAPAAPVADTARVDAINAEVAALRSRYPGLK